MRRHLFALVAVIAIAACSSPPAPTASPSATLVESSTPSSVASPTPTPTASAIPSSSLPSALVTEQVGRLSVTHPLAWHVIDGPMVVPNRPVPLFYLSDAPLTVGPCPTPDPTTGAFPACPMPLSALPAGGVLVVFSPNPGFMEGVPPLITVEAPDTSCRAVGGEAQVYSAAAGMVVIACLRGPDLPTHEAEVRGVINLLKLAS
jgi:hypothetical protein